MKNQSLQVIGITTGLPTLMVIEAAFKADTDTVVIVGENRNPFENSVPTFNITNRYDYLHETFLNGPVFPQKRRTNLTPKKKKRRKK